MAQPNLPTTSAMADDRPHQSPQPVVAAPAPPIGGTSSSEAASTAAVALSLEDDDRDIQASSPDHHHHHHHLGKRARADEEKHEVAATAAPSAGVFCRPSERETAAKRQKMDSTSSQAEPVQLHARTRIKHQIIRDYILSVTIDMKDICAQMMAAVAERHLRGGWQASGEHKYKQTIVADDVYYGITYEVRWCMRPACRHSTPLSALTCRQTNWFRSEIDHPYDGNERVYASRNLSHLQRLGVELFADEFEEDDQFIGGLGYKNAPRATEETVDVHILVRRFETPAAGRPLERLWPTLRQGTEGDVHFMCANETSFRIPYAILHLMCPHIKQLRRHEHAGTDFVIDVKTVPRDTIHALMEFLFLGRPSATIKRDWDLNDWLQFVDLCSVWLVNPSNDNKDDSKSASFLPAIKTVDKLFLAYIKESVQVNPAVKLEDIVKLKRIAETRDYLKAFCKEVVDMEKRMVYSI